MPWCKRQQMWKGKGKQTSGCQAASRSFLYPCPTQLLFWNVSKNEEILREIHTLTPISAFCHFLTTLKVYSPLQGVTSLQ